MLLNVQNARKDLKSKTTSPSLDYLILIQARLGSTRLPNKVMRLVGGKTMLRRVWDAAQFKWFVSSIKVVVAWPERYPDLDENNVLERFRRISNEFPSKWVIRLTSDCPLLTTNDIKQALLSSVDMEYYSNHTDGHDVQIFTREYLFSNIHTSKEHVIADFKTLPLGLSVNTQEDLDRVRDICRGK